MKWNIIKDKNLLSQKKSVKELTLDNYEVEKKEVLTQ